MSKSKKGSKWSKSHTRQKEKVIFSLKWKSKYPKSSNKKSSPFEKLQEGVGVEYTKHGHKLALKNLIYNNS